MLVLTISDVIWISCGILIAGVVSLILLVASYKKPAQGQVLIRRGPSDTHASFSGKVVLPLIHKAVLAACDAADGVMSRWDTGKCEGGIFCADQANC